MNVFLYNYDNANILYFELVGCMLRFGSFIVSSDTEYYVILQLNFQIEVQDRCQKSTDI